MNEVVIISGKGGTGKTTLTASLASLWDGKVIADCDVDAADLHILLHPEIREQADFYASIFASIDTDRCTGCGQCLSVCKYGAISEDWIVNRMDCEGCGVCERFCTEKAISLHDRRCGQWYISDTRFGPMVHARLGIAEENSGKLVSLIRREAKRIAESKNLDTILIDGSPGIGCPVISSIGGASLVVIVVEPTISGVHDMERVIQLVHHFQIPAAIVINKSGLNSEMENHIERKAAQDGLPKLGNIPYDPDVTQAMVAKKTVVDFGESPASRSIRNISVKLLDLLRDKKTA